LSGFGGGKAVKFATDEIPEAFFSAMAKESSPGAIEGTLRKIGMDEVTAKSLAPKFAESTTANEAKSVLADFGKPENYKTGNILSEPPIDVNLPAIAKANPVLFKEAQKANTVEAFITKMSNGKPETVDSQVLTDFYNTVNKPISTSAESFIKTKRLDPASVNILDNNKSIVESLAGNQAILTDIPLSDFGNPKFETAGSYDAGRKITDPIEVTLNNGVYEIHDGANRFTQAIANGDKTIPVQLEIINNGNYLTGDQLIKSYKDFADSPKKNNIKPKSSEIKNEGINLPPQLEQKQNEIQIKSEAIANSPFAGIDNKLIVDREGGVRELGDIKNPTLIKKIEDRMAEAGITDPAEFSKGVENYFKQKANLKVLQTQFNADKKIFLEGKTLPGGTPVRQMVRSNEIPSLMATAEESGISPSEQESGVRYKGKNPSKIGVRLEKKIEEAHRSGTYDPTVSEHNGGVNPPVGRGGITPPEIDWTKAKDKGTFRLARDTMERNLEKIAPREIAGPLKEFLVEPVRLNETNKVKFTNGLKIEIRAKMKELGIKRGSIEDALVQKLGEQNISLTDLEKATPKWREVQKASEYFRNLYDVLLDKINVVRTNYGYEPIPKRKDYFRHFQEINEFVSQFGVLFKPSELPTAISGITDMFNPGKPFTTAQLRRKGGSYTETAIGGMENYLRSVGNQMFHTDSVQRGRVLEKYLRESATKNPQIKLPNFAANLNEYTNFIAGKSARLDRALESIAGRPVVSFMNAMKQRFGANMIGGNISAAITHLIPVSFNLATVDKISAVKGLTETLASPFIKNWSNIDGMESKFLTRRFPVESILPTKMQKTLRGIGLPFQATDRFISRLAVGSKYYEGLSKGLSKEEAMTQADNYANRVIGDRSIGNLPNIMNTKTLGFLTQFQVEVNDNFSVLMHDIPHWNTGPDGKKNYSKILSSLVQFMVFSYLFNQFLKNLKGSGKGLDPIDMGLTLAGLNEEGKGLPFNDRAIAAAQDLGNELPFSSLVTGQYAIGQGLPDVPGLISGKTTIPVQAGNVAAGFLLPAGGSQIKKTIQGISAVNNGKDVTATGRTRFNIPQTTGNYVRASIFGKSSLPEAQKYYEGYNKSTLLNSTKSNSGSNPFNR
jgi:hypothetical protein